MNINWKKGGQPVRKIFLLWTAVWVSNYKSLEQVLEFREKELKDRGSIKDISFTSTAASNVKRTGIGEPSVGVMTPALSLALWSNASNLKRIVSNLQQWADKHGPKHTSKTNFKIKINQKKLTNSIIVTPND